MWRYNLKYFTKLQENEPFNEIPVVSPFSSMSTFDYYSRQLSIESRSVGSVVRQDGTTKTKKDWRRKATYSWTSRQKHKQSSKDIVSFSSIWLVRPTLDLFGLMILCSDVPSNHLQWSLFVFDADKLCTDDSGYYHNGMFPVEFSVNNFVSLRVMNY